MSTHNKLDKICVVIVVCSLILTALFINSESFGITKIVDEDAEQNSDADYFTANDLDGDWDRSEATVITLTGDDAEISGNGAYTNDGNVVITNAGYYVVSGVLTDGYLSVNAYDSSKVFILLDGVEINCSDDACIRVDQADKVFLTLAENSQNTLTSGSVYSEEALKDGTDGAVFAHDDLTINGSGSLVVNAEYRHGIAANDDLVITGGRITVTAAADAIHANDSLRITQASITVDAGDDGLVTSNEEENGYLYVESGTLNITAADDGIHTTGEITIGGGDFTISAGNDGIHSDASVSFYDGNLLINDCYEGIEALIIDVSGGEITIYPQDDGFNANGNSQNGAGGMGGRGMGGGHMGRGSMDASNSDTTASSDQESMNSSGQMPAPPDMAAADSTGQMPSPPDMADSDSTGQMPTPPETGTGAETDTGAQTTAEADQEETYINISGGTITIINENGNDADGLDSNGDLFISGGTIYVSLVGNGSNSAVDYSSESGGVAEISGGTIIACGASSMAEAFDSSSTQASILYNTSTTNEAGTTLAIEDTGGNVLLSWEVPCSFSSALVSFPGMETGGSYVVAIGDSTEEITLEEVSASYGDAQSGMFGGTMKWGGMQRRGGFNSDDSSAGSTDAAAEIYMRGNQGGHGHRSMQALPDQSDMSQDGTADAGAGQEPTNLPDTSRDGSTAIPAAEQASSDMAQEGMDKGPMQMQQEETSEDGEESSGAQGTAAPLDAETLAVLGGCTALLLAGIAVGKFYKKHS